MVLFFTIVFAIITVNIIAACIFKKRRLNIEDENIIEKMKQFNYRFLEIKRKRRARSAWGRIPSIYRYNECALEYEFPIPWSVMPPEDIIEIYGVKNKDKKYLIHRTDWSKDEAKKLNAIVEEINKKTRV